jgi:DNA-directed RNA polymerase sigma subunit (sigma70/sigma32)
MANKIAASTSITLSPEQGLSRYLTEIRKFPMLEKDEEFMLAKRWREHEDTEAATRWSPPTCVSWPRSPWAIAAMACRWPK